LQHEGSETRGYCIYDVTWINPLRIKVTHYIPSYQRNLLPLWRYGNNGTELWP